MKAPLLSLEITRFEKTGGPLTKRVYLKSDGAIANDSSDCRMSRGVMHRQHLVTKRDPKVRNRGLRRGRRKRFYIGRGAPAPFCST
jgi:hypothetical protein